MQDTELYRLLGSLEESNRNNTKMLEKMERDHSDGINEIKELLRTSVQERNLDLGNIQKRLNRVEVAIGKFGVKIAVGGVFMLAILNKAFSLISERFFSGS